MANDKPLVKAENVEIFWIECNEEAAIDAKKSEEVTTAFLNETLLPKLTAMATQPCMCQQKELQERAIAKARLMPNLSTARAVAVEITQADVDRFEYGVVVTLNAGIDPIIVCIIESCKCCGRVRTIQGSAKDVTLLVARAVTSALNDGTIPIPYDIQPATDGTPKVDVPLSEYAMEDLDTGEVTACDSLGKALFGNNSTEDVMISDIDEKPPAAEK